MSMLAVEDEIVAKSGGVNYDGLIQLMEQLHAQNTESIRLLREDIQRVESTVREDVHRVQKKVEEMDSAQIIVDRRLTSLASTPIEVDKIRFPPRMVVAIVAGCMALIGGVYAANYGVRSDVRDILTTISNQKALNESQQRLDAERAANLRESIEAMKRRQELQQYEIQGLKEAILKGTAR